MRFGGQVPWRDLLEPTIQLCEEGHVVNWHMARALQYNRVQILSEPSMRFVDMLNVNVFSWLDNYERAKLVVHSTTFLA